MIINDISYIGSFNKLSQCPKGQIPEYAFIGRSNVGKSSLINMLCRRREIARISKTPGKTQMINFFLVDQSWHMVDLPGYGYANSSKTKRKSWSKMTVNYFLNRMQLKCAFVLIDIRHELQKLDLDFINWIGENGIPFAIVYTKTDKLKTHQVPRNAEIIRNSLLQYWESLPSEFYTSAIKGDGREELLDFIKQLNHKIL